jgi:hypothetical protein
MPNAPIILVIATPCYGGQVSSLYAASLLKLQQACLRRGDIDLVVSMLGGDALVTRARQNLVAHFLGNPAASHLLFIDADIGFEPEQVFRLFEFGADVSAAIYPVKRIEWAKLRTQIAQNLDRPETRSLSYVVELEETGKIEARDGFARARYVGGGFMMIRRAALIAMTERYPELRYSREHQANDPLAGTPWRFALFDCLIDAATGVYLSEDYSFCRRWTDMGGLIWADMESRLTHTGGVTFTGDFTTQFTRS